MSITIKEIAKIAGTSRGTVDRVLNGRGNVREELQNKILKIALENNYTPNPTAKMLSESGRPHKIGIIINSIGNEFFDEVLNGIKAIADKYKTSNIDLIIREIKGYQVESQLMEIDFLLKQDIEGLAITPIDSELVRDKLNYVISKGIPVVFINSDLGGVERMLMVGCDNRLHGRLAANLTELTLNDNAKVAIITGSFKNISNRKRTDCYCEMLSNSKKHISITDIIEGNDDDNITYLKVKEYFVSHPDTDLLYFCAAGTKGGLAAMQESSKHCKAITVDINSAITDGLINDYVIATITQEPYMQGYLSLNALAEYIYMHKKPDKNKIHTESDIKLKYSKGIIKN